MNLYCDTGLYVVFRCGTRNARRYEADLLWAFKSSSTWLWHRIAL